MASLRFSTVLSRTIGGLFHGAPNRRARRALGRKTSSTRPAGSSRRRVRPCLEMLEDRITPTDNTFSPTVFTDGISSGGQIKTLRDAINASNAEPFAVPDHTDTIQLAAGTYTLSIPNTSAHDIQNLSGDLNINATNHNWIIQGATDKNGNPTTIIKQTVADRVFQILNASDNPENVTFKNLIIEGGDAQESGGDGTAGGLSDAQTDALGGGILDGDGEGTVTLSNVGLSGNQAVAITGFNAFGGGIFATGDDQGRGSLVIQNSFIEANSALGGAVGSSGPNGEFPGTPKGGTARGGGVFASGCSLTISGSSLQDNIVTGGNTTNTTPSTGNGGQAAGGSVFFTSNDSLSLTQCNLSGNMLTGGSADTLGGVGGAAFGGSIFAHSNSITINSCTETGNTLTGGSNSAGPGGSAVGGGVLVEGTTTIQSSAFTNNILTGGNGTIASSTINKTSNARPESSVVTPGDIGGMAAGGAIWASGTTVITGCNLAGHLLFGGTGSLDNASASFAGDVGGEVQGGSVVVGGKSATISTSFLSANDITGGKGNYRNGTVAGTVGGSASGGGVYVSAHGGAKPNITISDSILVGNIVNGGNGNTVPAGPGFTENIGSTVGGSASGGGVHVSTLGGGTPLVTIRDSTLSGNTASGGNGSTTSVGPLHGASSLGFASGGGVRLDAGSFLDLLNSTIANNRAIGGQGASINPVAAGGGLYFDVKAGAQLVNVSVVGNQASPAQNTQGSTTGGGIDNENTLPGAVGLVNTLVALNTASTGPDFFGTASNAQHNLIGIADGSSGFSAVDGNLLGSAANPLNPQVGQLTNNGGTTQTIALLAGSPAINAGVNIPQSQIGPFDQRGPGFARVSGGTTDIGAFEVQQQSSAVVKPPVVAPSPAPPPALHTPSLLAFFDSLLAGVETMNSDGTVTVTDGILGIPLFVASYDSNGDLLSVTFLGINLTFLFELL